MNPGDLCKLESFHASYNSLGVLDTILEPNHPMIVLSVHSVASTYVRVLTTWGVRTVEIDALVPF